VQLSLIDNAGLGAIVALVIWATYFVLVWVSSTTVGSLVGSVVNTATSGFQAIMGTATAALGANAAKNQVVKRLRQLPTLWVLDWAQLEPTSPGKHRGLLGHAAASRAAYQNSE